MDPEILKLLGLTADATEEEQKAALADRLNRASAADDLELKLATATGQVKAGADALAELRASAEAEAQKKRDADVAALEKSAQASGLWAPGDKRHDLFKRLADTDLDAAKDYVGTLQPSNPVGAPSQSKGTEPPSSSSLDAQLRASYGLDDMGISIVKEQMGQLGVSEEMLKKHGPAAREERESKPGFDWLNKAAEVN